MSGRKFNFNPGPAVLPLSALEQAQKDLIDFAGTGIGILESSHRAKEFDAVFQETKARMAKLMKLPADRKILFFGGGANLQFAMLPMNLLPKGSSADYVNTGVWAGNALKNAKLIGDARSLLDTKGEDGVYRRVPSASEIKVTPGAAYLHLCSNNTIFGTQYHEWPDTGDVPLVVDMSSDILCRELDWSRFDLVYAGAQKNLGPAGVTIVIISQRLLERCADGLPMMLSYKQFVAKDSLGNTPPCFPIYMVNLVLKWVEEQGGVAAVEKVNRKKAAALYDLFDAQPDFFRGTAEKGSRSLMNVTFRLPSEELEKKLISEATAAGFVGLKGHRDVGGLRASLYNAMSLEGVEKLVEFMKGFAKKS
ncbi:MAG: 3-phosphoserine/phosphohydroxythreonine transaminase [Polyangia bacterium]|jgi:phosphoserine aminotransferase|nr:3-phosphoserine/phosphohydroxythreonine transaminase [Polyangia bacterium]